MRLEQVTKQLEIEFIVLDNQYAFRHHLLRIPVDRIGFWPITRIVMRPSTENGNGFAPDVLALLALGWVLSDESRASRLLALTGLDADQLRQSAESPTLLRAVIDFLASHEPDLVACAEALGVDPLNLASTARELGR